MMLHARYWCVGGTSAGHILPAVHAAERYAGAHASEVIAVTDATQIDIQTITSVTDVHGHMPLTVTVRKGPKVLRGGAQVVLAAYASVKAAYWLVRRPPRRIITTGGRVAFPVCCAAWIMRVPIDVYELNASPGRAVTYLSHIAEHVYVCFTAAQARLPRRAHVHTTTYPLSPKMYHGYTKQQAREALGIAQDACVVLILGGSQGSAAVNAWVADMLAHLDIASYIFVHQTGVRETSAVEAMYAAYQATYNVFPFTDTMHLYYAAADCCIARAGAGTLWELMHHEVPAYVVPLEGAAQSHQLENAREMEQMRPDIIWMRRHSTVTGSDMAAFVTSAVSAAQAHTRATHTDDQAQLDSPS